MEDYIKLYLPKYHMYVTCFVFPDGGLNETFLFFNFYIFGGGRWKTSLLYSIRWRKGVRIDQLCVCVFVCFVLFCLHCHEPLVFHGWVSPGASHYAAKICIYTIPWGFAVCMYVRMW